MKQTILFLRNGNLYSTREEAIEGLNGVSHKIGQPVIALYGTTGAVELIFAIGTEEGEYKIIQEGLASGLNIKTINNISILGSGNLEVGNIITEDIGEELDDVETNTYVKYVAQTLTDEQKAQVRENIGVNSSNDNIDYVKKEELSEVAISGSYNDLLDKPTQITKPILEAPCDDITAGFIGDNIMKHGVIYVSQPDNIGTAITIENFEAPDKDVVEYVWHFQTGTMPTLSLPSYIHWANGELPEIEDDTVYELSITATRHYSTSEYIYKAVLVPFKTI